MEMHVNMYVTTAKEQDDLNKPANSKHYRLELDTSASRMLAGKLDFKVFPLEVNAECVGFVRVDPDDIHLLSDMLNLLGIRREF